MTARSDPEEELGGFVWFCVECAPKLTRRIVHLIAAALARRSSWPFHVQTEKVYLSVTVRSLFGGHMGRGFPEPSTRLLCRGHTDVHANLRKPLLTTGMWNPFDKVDQRRVKLSVAVWLLHIVIVATCFPLRIDWPVSAVLFVAWAVSLIACIFISRPSPRLSVVVIVISMISASSLILSVLLQLSCIQGDCI